MKTKRKYIKVVSKTKQPLKFKKEQGRNEPCKCGSTKKYKHCCLVKLNLEIKQRIINANKK